MANLAVSWIATWTAFYLVSTSIIIYRLQLRHSHGRFANSDVLTTVCLVLSTVLYALALATGELGFFGTFKPSKGPIILLLSFFYMITAAIVVPFSKLCVGLLLYEVEVNDSWKLRLKIVQLLIALTCLVNVTLSFFGCYGTPAKLYWTVIKGQVPKDPGPTHQQYCVVRNNLVIVNSALNVAWELALFICALSLVFRVRTSKLQKLGLACSFAAGLVTIGATIMNGYWTDRIVKHSRPSPADFHTNGIWTAVEAYTSLIVASLLPIRAQLVGFVDRLVSPLRRAKVWPEDSFASTGTGSGITRNKEGDEEEDLEYKYDANGPEAHAVQVRHIESPN